MLGIFSESGWRTVGHKTCYVTLMLAHCAHLAFQCFLKLKWRRHPDSNNACVRVASPGVCSWQRAVCWCCYDLEGGAERVKATGRELRGAGGELKETCKLFLSEGRHNGPEPLHHLQTRTRAHTHSSLWTSLLVMVWKVNVYAFKRKW